MKNMNTGKKLAKRQRVKQIVPRKGKEKEKERGGEATEGDSRKEESPINHASTVYLIYYLELKAEILMDTRIQKCI